MGNIPKLLFSTLGITWENNPILFFILGIIWENVPMIFTMLRLGRKQPPPPKPQLHLRSQQLLKNIPNVEFHVSVFSQLLGIFPFNAQLGILKRFLWPCFFVLYLTLRVVLFRYHYNLTDLVHHQKIGCQNLHPRNHLIGQLPWLQSWLDHHYHQKMGKIQSLYLSLPLAKYSHQLLQKDSYNCQPHDHFQIDQNRIQWCYSYLSLFFNWCYLLFVPHVKEYAKQSQCKVNSNSWLL